MTALCTPQELNAKLAKLSRGQVVALSELADVPFSTLYMRAPDRDIMLSAAVKVLEVLPLVQRLNLPTREGYKAWAEAQKKRVLADARVQTKVAKRAR